MSIHPDAGKPVAKENLADVAELVSLYYETQPDVNDPDQRVAFGTSGHRGSSLKTSFTEDHIMAIAQAICEYRTEQGTTGPLFMGKDTHAEHVEYPGCSVQNISLAPLLNVYHYFSRSVLFSFADSIYDCFLLLFVE